MGREDLIDFERYEISEEGVYSKHYKKMLPGTRHSAGYRKIRLKCIDGKKRDFLFHRILAYCFIPNPENKPEVDHIIPLSMGGTDEISNLRWVTSSENSRNPYTLEANTVAQHMNRVYAYKDGELFGSWESENAAARSLGINQGNIHNCATGRCQTYKGYNWSYFPL